MFKVLIIEDNAILRENTVELLELSGYKVFTASNGREGFVSANFNKPDVILCDIVMPESGGLAFLSLVKKESSTHDIPLIFFSAGSAPLSVTKGIEQGADEYLSKPFSDEDLLSMIRRCCLLHVDREKAKL